VLLQEKTLEMMGECIDGLADEERKKQDWQRSMQRNRKGGGQELPEPARLDSMLISNQMNNYCTQVTQFAGQATSRMFLASSLNSQQ
jgi:hypothetical protein